ncbi:MAG: hypothetical protein U1E25_15115 [Methylocystis sp.]
MHDAAAKQARSDAADREWFASHHDRSHRLRLALPDEIEQAEGPAPDGKWVYVAIRQIEPGLLAKLVFWASPAPVDTDAAIEEDCADVFAIMVVKGWVIIIDDLREERQ